MKSPRGNHNSAGRRRWAGESFGGTHTRYLAGIRLSKKKKKGYGRWEKGRDMQREMPDLPDSARSSIIEGTAITGQEMELPEGHV